MPDTIEIIKIDEVMMKIVADPGVMMELSTILTFMVPGYQFMPTYRNKMWDGKIRLLNYKNHELYIGLLHEVKKFAKSRDYNLIVDEELLSENSFSVHEVKHFLDSLTLPFQPRDYQIKSFAYAIRNHRGLILSPTGSGKSFIIYLILKYYNKKTLLIVPTISLVTQMKSDLISYGIDEQDIHTITAGAKKESDRGIVISTWQSIYKQNKDYFQQYEVVFGDECHLFKSKSLIEIMTKLTKCKYRFGFTGTLDGTLTHKLVLQGLFGEVKQYTKTVELIKDEHLSPFNIKCLILKHTDEECKHVSRLNYQDEMDYLVSNDRRNKFIVSLAISLRGNSLLLFQYVEKHGKVLHDLIQQISPEREVHFVHGGINAEEREMVRERIESNENDLGVIIIASYGVFSTGINAPNLNNVVFCSPSKSRIRNLQSIGRVLRVSEGKDTAVLYDIADDLKHKTKSNFTLKHFIERIKIYNEENFNYKFYNVKL